MIWAKENGVEFEPAKYAIMHFQKPGSKLEEIKVLPNIAGVTSETLKATMRVLGVLLDNRLTWQGHVAQVSVESNIWIMFTNLPKIRQKVLAEMRNIEPMSAATWGTSLKRMRQYYVTKILPMIAYGCGIWFLRDPHGKRQLSDSLMKSLESLQYQCLRRVAGAYKQTSAQQILKELHIYPLDIELERRAMAFRARIFDPKATISLEPCRTSSGRSRPRLRIHWEDHPYHALDRQAEALYWSAKRRLEATNTALRKCNRPVRRSWMNAKDRSRAINACARGEAERHASERWEMYRVNQQDHKHKRISQPVLWDCWGKMNSQRYKNLSRARSSIL